MTRSGVGVDEMDSIVLLFRQFFDSCPVGDFAKSLASAPQQKIAYKNIGYFLLGRNQWGQVCSVYQLMVGRSIFMMQTVGQKENGMKKSELVASGMTLPQIGRDITHSIIDMGGTDEDVKDLLNNRPLCDELAKVVLRRNIIVVDRTSRPSFQEEGMISLYPELENIGPLEFEVSSLSRWYHPEQKKGNIGGELIYGHLKEKGWFSNCLGSRELDGIQAKGSVFVRRHFADESVVGWKSICSRIDNDALFVPYIVEHKGELVRGWHWLGHGWTPRDSVLHIGG